MNDASGQPLSNFQRIILYSHYWTELPPLDAPRPIPEPAAVKVSKAEPEQDGGKDADSYKLNPVNGRA